MKHKIVSVMMITVLALSVWGSMPAKKAQAATCTSAKSGNWNAADTWSCGAVPSAADDVIIQSAHQIALTQNESVNNLTIQNASTRLQGAFTLQVYGTLDSSTTPNASIISSATLIKFVGATRLLFGANWGATTTSLQFEVALNAGATGTSSSSVKAGSITVSSGTFDMTGTGKDLRPDAGSTSSGILTIADGATLIVNSALSRTATSNDAFASFTITGNGTFKTSSTATDVWPSGTTTSFSNGSTIEYSGSSQTIQSAAYGILVISGTGTKTSAASSLTLNGGLTINASTFSAPTQLTLGGNFINNSTFTAGTGMVTFNGISQQTIGGASRTDFSGLTINSGATVVVPSDATQPRANTVSNNGSLKQTQTVNANSTAVNFIRLRNVANSADTYFGADLARATGNGDLGSTTLAVQGNAACSNALGHPVKRCFTIDKALSSADTLKLYYIDAELQGQTESNIHMWQYAGSGTSWNEVLGTRSNDAANNFVQVVLNAATVAGQPYVLKETLPTAIHLASFTATQAGDHNTLAWETTSELRNLGFNLWRGTSAGVPTVKLNQYVIPSQAPSGTDGYSYSYNDSNITSGATYYYWLDDVDLNGTVTRHGPVSTAGDTPTAVTLNGFTATSPAATTSPASMWPLLGFGAIGLAGAVALLRRRK